MSEADAIIEASKFWRDFNDSRVKTNYNQLLEWSDKLTLDQKFDRIFKLLEPNESNELFYLSMCGIQQGEIILMGSEAYENYMAYKKEMVDKYYKK